MLDSMLPAITEVQANILRYMYERPEGTHAEIVAHLNLALRTVERNIKALRDEGLLLREGSRKAGRYEIQFYAV